jgi:molecular chaperone DnaJ
LEAYEILSNKAKRERYDRSGGDLPLTDFFWEEGSEETGEEEDGSWEGFEDLFPEKFKSGGPGLSLLPQRGKDLFLRVEIDFESALRGTVEEVQVLQEATCLPCSGTGIDPQSPVRVCEECGGAGQVQIGLSPSAFAHHCRRCRGMGRVRVQGCQFCSGRGWVHRKKVISLQLPPGVDDRCRVFLMKLGQAGKNGGLNGDLIAEVKVKNHPYFRRKGDDLYVEVPLSLWEAALGTEVEVPALTGAMKVKVPPGVQPGDECRLPGQGAPSLHEGRRGDQVLSYKVMVPRHVDGRSKRCLEELKRRNPENPRQECSWRWKS